MQEYGALLGLYEDQQANLLKRDADAVLASATAIESQVRRAQAARELRERLVRTYAINIGSPADATLRSLLDRFPAEVQPLVDALISEINHLIRRIRRGARHNQTLLARAVSSHEEVLRAIKPSSMTKTYSPRGNVSVLPTQAAWQAAG